MSTPPSATHVSQKDAFIADEGNQWFARNQSLLTGASPGRTEWARRVAQQLPLQHQSKVLEVGCGQGDNLEQLALLRPIEAHGVDPSDQAVAAGSARNAALTLCAGTADNLPYADASFDVVWFGFCLYLVDRHLLQRAVAEADRVLRDGGLLVIVDFDPSTPCRRPYHHRPGLYSYKMNYAGLFLANPAYSLVEKHATSHTTGEWTADPQERIALHLCRKNLDQAYPQFSTP